MEEIQVLGKAQHLCIGFNTLFDTWCKIIVLDSKTVRLYKQRKTLDLKQNLMTSRLRCPALSHMSCTSISDYIIIQKDGFCLMTSPAVYV